MVVEALTRYFFFFFFKAHVVHSVVSVIATHKRATGREVSVFKASMDHHDDDDTRGKTMGLSTRFVCGSRCAKRPLEQIC